MTRMIMAILLILSAGIAHADKPEPNSESELAAELTRRLHLRFVTSPRLDQACVKQVEVAQRSRRKFDIDVTIIATDDVARIAETAVSSEIKAMTERGLVSADSIPAIKISVSIEASSVRASQRLFINASQRFAQAEAAAGRGNLDEAQRLFAAAKSDFLIAHRGNTRSSAWAWAILAALCSRQTDHAKELALAFRNRGHCMTPNVYRSMQRIQGPHRLAFEELVNDR